MPLSDNSHSSDRHDQMTIACPLEQTAAHASSVWPQVWTRPASRSGLSPLSAGEKEHTDTETWFSPQPPPKAPSGTRPFLFPGLNFPVCARVLLACRRSKACNLFNPLFCYPTLGSGAREEPVDFSDSDSARFSYAPTMLAFSL